MSTVEEVISLHLTLQHSSTQHLPAQHAQHQVENKEGSKDHQADKVDPRQLKAHRIIHL